MISAGSSSVTSAGNRSDTGMDSFVLSAGMGSAGMNCSVTSAGRPPGGRSCRTGATAAPAPGVAVIVPAVIVGNIYFVIISVIDHIRRSTVFCGDGVISHDFFRRGRLSYRSFFSRGSSCGFFRRSRYHSFRRSRGGSCRFFCSGPGGGCCGFFCRNRGHNYGRGDCYSCSRSRIHRFCRYGVRRHDCINSMGDNRFYQIDDVDSKSYP